ncbi:arylsulfatase [Blastopirellula sp. JC732]|uniref:Arylsulfatase n=1 Tax=Blastopirellula sediminis TaxID=2894196 RepID=A0A9X1MPR3_9BACT|nr:arylsulfatase [Blastopirellula sediminis]MCC9606137.1 arylsulfatase [Blastopirellula sediminis]MCC9630564.1 arylsulfatase [Blastopirellula sediminis]
MRYRTLLPLLILLLIGSIGFGQEMLPQPEAPFKGKIGLTYKDSVAVKPELKIPNNLGLKNPPNILLVLIDDCGYGQMGTFGGGIPTPNMDRVANNGLRYTRFHTTALCSPTRAALLTGRNHHSVASGTIGESGTGFPGYTGVIPSSAGTVAEILREYGYCNAWFGKNHNVPDWETSLVGPFDRWADGLGFDYFYGFVGGDTDQFSPALVENKKRMEAPETNEDGSPYHFTTDITDHAIRTIRAAKAVAPQRPFFVYFATGATHAPHQVPQEWVEKFKGKFDGGWDKYREETFARQKEMGIIPQNAKLTARPDSLPAWDSVPEDQRKVYARMMEVFAAFTAHTDHEVGRLIDAVDEIGELDNTIIIYMAGDNGSSAEGGLEGLVNEMTFFNAIPEPLEMKLEAMDTLGGPLHYNHFPAAWAHAMDTPYQWTKQIASHFGGTRNGLAISWPNGIKARGEIRDQFHHVIDITPTLLEITGITAPVEIDGIAQKPIEGVSMAYTFDDADAEDRRTTQYFEMLGNQGIYHEGWMASAIRGVPWLSENAPGDLLDMPWELYNVEEDFTQANDLAKQKPEKVRELVKLFFAEAAKYNVLPLDDRKTERLNVENRPSLTEGRTKFVYPNLLRLPEGASPDLKHKSHTVTADVEIPDQGAEGMIFTQGGRFGGYGLFVKDGKLVYHYNLVGVDRYTVESTTRIPPGKTTLKMVYKTDADEPFAGADVTLYAGDQLIGKGRVEKSIPNRVTLDETFDFGFDTGTPVMEGYDMPFDFTGKLNAVTIELK